MGQPVSSPSMVHGKFVLGKKPCDYGRRRIPLLDKPIGSACWAGPLAIAVQVTKTFIREVINRLQMISTSWRGRIHIVPHFSWILSCLSGISHPLVTPAPDKNRRSLSRNWASGPTTSSFRWSISGCNSLFLKGGISYTYHIIPQYIIGLLLEMGEHVGPRHLHDVDCQS